MDDRSGEDFLELPLSTQLPIAEIVGTLWHRRAWLATLAGGALLLGYAGSFLMPREYKSTTQLMPPDQQLLASTSMLNMLMMGGSAAAFSPAAAGGLLNQKTPGSVAIGVLASRTVQEHLIQRFDLAKVYRDRYQEDTRKSLTKRTVLDEDKKTGIVSITVEDRDPQRARDMAAAYVQELASVVTNLSTSSARRERMFLEQRIRGVKADLDTSSHALSQFSSRNATFDPQKQGQATVEATGKLQSELTVAQSELSSLRTTFTDENVRVAAARARIASLQGELNRLGGQGGDGSGAQALPSVRQLPLLGYTYYDLYRQVQMQETLFETLTKQYELARVQEAKELPPIKVLDEANIPDKRSSPTRWLVAVAVMMVTLLGAITWVVGRVFWATRAETDPLKTFARELAQAVDRPNTDRPTFVRQAQLRKEPT